MGLTALWWWIDRWRKSTAYTDLTLDAQAAYRNLLDEAWLRRGPIPNDERILAKASGDARRWRRIRGKVLARFVLKSDGFWHNETLDEVLAESTRRAEKQRHYRDRRGNAPSNGAGNTGGNRGGSPSPSPSLGSAYLGTKGKGTGKGKRAALVGKRRNAVCPHTPTCATWTKCTALIIEEGRRTKALKS